MLLAAHSLVGASIGEVSPNPVLSFLLALVSHFILDAIPHYDTTDEGQITLRQITLVIVDGIVGFILLVVILINYSDNRAGLVLGVVGGILPDFFSTIPGIRGITEKVKPGRIFQDFHQNIQSKSLPPLVGLLVQMALASLCLYLFIRNVV